MARKVFISFLGFSNYGSCKYVRDDFTSAPVRFIQEATLEYLTSKETWTDNDKAYILLTQGAARANWVDNGHTDRNTREPIACQGLKTRLEQARLPMAIEPVTGLPDGNNEAEIWEIFNRVFDLLEEGDTLYFDLTHGFRYLPMLALVMGNYAKFLKKATVASITYGNFEGRNRDTDEALIVDLLPLNMLQEWSSAASNYMICGNADGITELTNSKVRPILKASKGADDGARSLRDMSSKLNSLIEALNTCRGVSIVDGKLANDLLTALRNADSSVIMPLSPIMEQLAGSISALAHTDCPANTIGAARWCCNHNLFQQAITILQEGIVSIMCRRNGIMVDDEEKREAVNKAFYIKALHDDNAIPAQIDKLNDHLKPLVQQVLGDHMMDNTAFVDTFSDMTMVRNDFNHSGMRSKRAPLKPGAIKAKINTFIKVMEGIDTHSEQLQSSPKVLVNLSNHPSADWSPEQMQAAMATWNEVVDYPFPAVDPTADEKEIQDMARNIVNDITAQHGTTGITVHVMGEFCLTHALIQRFGSQGITCVASTSTRIVNETEPGRKVVEFRFVRFRRY